MAKVANSVIGTKPAEVDVVEKAPQKNSKRGILALITSFVMGAGFLILPAMATTPDINLTWVGTMFASLISAANLCAAPAQSFIETWFPVIVEFVVYGIVLAVLGCIGYAFRGVIMAGVKMLENILK